MIALRERMVCVMYTCGMCHVCLALTAALIISDTHDTDTALRHNHIHHIHVYHIHTHHIHIHHTHTPWETGAWLNGFRN